MVLEFSKGKVWTCIRTSARHVALWGDGEAIALEYYQFIRSTTTYGAYADWIDENAEYLLARLPDATERDRAAIADYTSSLRGWAHIL